MTFLDAAIAILQREGRPLHYKQLTEIAINENLLTVVGRTPDVTMQQRLNDALKKADPGSLLVRDKPGVFGLRYYPTQPEATPPEATQPEATQPEVEAASEPIGEGAGEERRRRRRGGRGRRKGGAEAEETERVAAAAGADEASAAEPSASEAMPSPPSAPPAPIETVAPVVAAPALRPADEGTIPERRSFAEAAAVVQAAHRRLDAQRQRSDGAQHRQSEGEQGDASQREQESRQAPVAVEAPPSPTQTTAPSVEAASVAPTPISVPAEAAVEQAADQGFEDEELEHTTGPVMAPAFGTEELVRGEEHRRVYEEPRERHRRRDRRDRDRERPATRPAETVEARGPGPAPAPTPRPAEPSAAEASPIQAVVEILRNTDGRPMHLRQIVEMALKRKLLRGEVQDLVRLLRGAIIVDGREREVAGLRPRVRNAGGANYVLADRRLEPELAQLERELSERSERLADATRKALLRRIGRLPAPGFEALMRLLLARLGLVQAEPIKRGEGVGYFSAERPQSQGRRRRVLVAMWPGEAELTRRAVGELRMGIEARGFDEGLLLAAGRAGAEALAELSAAGGAVTLCDGDELGSLCLRHGVGATRRALPLVTLDLDLFGDLAEG